MAYSRRAGALLFGLLGAALPACKREPAPVLVIDARNPPAPPVASPPQVDAAVAAIAVAKAPPAAGSEDQDATVEISGAIALPPGPATKDHLFVYVTRGDCLNDSVPLLRRLPVSDNRTYYANVLAPRGSSLAVCAAAEPAGGKPPHLYGRARAALTLTNAVDQSFADIDITLAEDTPRRFPTAPAR